MSSLVVGCTVSILHVLLCNDIYNDVAYAYLPMVQDFVAGNWESAFNGLPILVPTLAGIIAKTGINEFTSMIIVSCGFYLATIPLIYHFVKYFFPEGNYAAWGALLYAAAPKIIRFSCTGLLNSSRNFFLLLSIYLLFSYSRKPKFRKLVYLGISLGGLSFARGEGSLAIPIIILGLAVLLFTANRSKFDVKSCAKFFMTCIVPLIVLAIILTPRVLQTYIHYGVPFIDARQMIFFEKLTKFRLTCSWQETVNPKPFPRISYEHDIPQRKKPAPLISIKRFNKFLSCFSRGAYEPYFILAVIGIIFWLSKKNKEYIVENSIIGITILMFCIVYYCIVNSYRYFTFILPLLMPFTLAGAKEVSFYISRYIKDRYLRPTIGVVFIVLFVAQISNGLQKVISSKNDYEKACGAWIKKYINKSKLKSKLDLSTPLLYTEKPPIGYWAKLNFEPFGLPSNDMEKSIFKKYLIENVDLILLDKKDKKSSYFISSIENFIEINHPYKKYLEIYRAK